ncbi:hypothetical protein KUCAC02_000768 [Chaenocephalus aceratus]|uniref:Uncharacterized protein n=1 Tax=Chaenocephalus aceratus TaxID=36190 RepID=A0ACB9W6V4_CHAAC|nr:hypothetical protein KUCAC02_000768 [Chaenocephalus aceratus]
MEISEARGASKCVEKMEKEVAPQKRQHCRTTVVNIISSLCSVASIAFCILLSINTADVKNRVVDLESGNDEHTLIRAPGYSMDDFNSLIEQRVDDLFSQRSYEQFVKIRTARQASPECSCPPGTYSYFSPIALWTCGFLQVWETGVKPVCELVLE